MMSCAHTYSIIYVGTQDLVHVLPYLYSCSRTKLARTRAAGMQHSAAAHRQRDTAQRASNIRLQHIGNVTVPKPHAAPGSKQPDNRHNNMGCSTLGIATVPKATRGP